MPDRATLAAYIAEAGETELDDIARHYGLKGADRRALRFMLRDMEEEGTLGRRGRKGVAPRGALPPVGVVEVTERDADGDLFVRLAKAAEDAPLVRLAPGKTEALAGAPGLGDRLLVKFETLENGETEARVIKVLGPSTGGATRMLGVVRKSRREVRVEPVDRKSKETLVIPDGADLKDGDLVLAAIMGSDNRYGPKRGRVLEVVGREDQPRAASLIALHTHSIPTGFPAAA